MKEFVRDILQETFEKCCEEGLLKSTRMPEFVVEVPRNKGHGDLAANLAMVLAKQEKKPPREIAGMLVLRLEKADSRIEKTEIAGPGFINFYLKENVWHRVLKQVEGQGARFGSADIGKGEKVLVEFVSANPTGPLHIGHGRGAALGDAVANILEHAGYSVEREYYINDVGNQMRNLGKAVYLRYLELLKQEVQFTEDLYQGAYIYGIAKEVILKQGNRFLERADEEEAVDFFTGFASAYILKGIEQDLDSFGVHFNTWFSEKKLFESGKVQKSIGHFKQSGLAYEKEGALWFRTTKFGDEKDRVLIKEDGNTTYFASDTAYHEDKFIRGFKYLIDIWGADHHGYIPRVRAVLEALGLAHESFSVILVQMVNLLREGTPVAMSTRSGEFVTLREVIDEVGKDAARFIFLTRRSDAQLDFDLAVAKKQSDENPVYYVQYAHARICSIMAFAGEKGFSIPQYKDIDANLLTAPEELDLIKKIAQFPETVEGSARAFEPHRIATYLLELVGQFHSYYNKLRVITEEQELSLARLYLMSCIRCVLKNGLALLGVNAPEKM
jgi:arginyl-tRNA synthetase